MHIHAEKRIFSSPIPLFYLYYLSDSPVLIYLFFCEFQKTNPQRFHLFLSLDINLYMKKKTFQRSVEKYWHLKHGGIKVLPYCWNLTSHYGLINYQIDFVSPVLLRSPSNHADACPVMFPCLLSLMLI